MFDHEGSGQEDKTAVEVTSDLKTRLEQNGWKDRAEIILLEPELEAWVWSVSPHVDEVLGWKNRTPTLREWLIQKQFVSINHKSLLIITHEIFVFRSCLQGGFAFKRCFIDLSGAVFRQILADLNPLRNLKVG